MFLVKRFDSFLAYLDRYDTFVEVLLHQDQHFHSIPILQTTHHITPITFGPPSSFRVQPICFIQCGSLYYKQSHLIRNRHECNNLYFQASSKLGVSDILTKGALSKCRNIHTGLNKNTIAIINIKDKPHL